MYAQQSQSHPADHIGSKQGYVAFHFQGLQMLHVLSLLYSGCLPVPYCVGIDNSTIMLFAKGSLFIEIM